MGRDTVARRLPAYITHRTILAIHVRPLAQSTPDLAHDTCRCKTYSFPRRNLRNTCKHKRVGISRCVQPKACPVPHTRDALRPFCHVLPATRGPLPVQASASCRTIARIHGEANSVMPAADEWAPDRCCPALWPSPFGRGQSKLKMFSLRL